MNIDEILKFSQENKKIYFKNNNFRTELFKDKNHYYFVWLVQGLKNEEVLYLLDDDIITFLEKDSRREDKLNAIMTSDNPYVNSFLKKERVIKMIIESYDRLRSYISYLDADFARAFFNYIIDHDLSYLSDLKEDVQLIVIKENLTILKEKKLPIDFLLNLSKNVVEFLLNNDLYFLTLLVNARADDIDVIVRKGVTLPIQVQTSKIVIDSYLKITDINKSWDYINNLENNPYLKNSIVEKRRKKYTEEINNVNSQLEIFAEYIPILEGKTRFQDPLLNFKLSKLSGKGEILAFLQEITITKMLEQTVDTFYQDLTYNFLKNVEILLSFVSQIPDNIIPSARLDIYKKFLTYYNLTTRERIELFNTLNNGQNHVEEFYDDFRKCKDYSYQMLKDSLIDISHLPVAETIEKINVYKLDGEDFKILVSSTLFPRENGDYPDYIWFEGRKKTVSTSLIGEENLQVFGDYKSGVILGFADFDPQNIMITYHGDAYTNENGTNTVSQLYTPDGLINATESYNEILVNERKEALKPSYVICYDDVKEGDIKAAKLLGGIPLIVINTKKYKFKKNYHADRETYKSPAQLYNITSYRDITYKKR